MNTRCKSLFGYLSQNSLAFRTISFGTILTYSFNCSEEGIVLRIIPGTACNCMSCISVDESVALIGTTLSKAYDHRQASRDVAMYYLFTTQIHFLFRHN